MSVLSVAVLLLWIVMVVVAILVLLLYRQFGLVYLGSGRRVHLTGIDEGRTAANHHRLMLDGKPGELDWSNAGPGRGTVVIFATPQCQICDKLLPQLDDAVALWGNIADFVFVDRPLTTGAPVKRTVPDNRSWVYAVSPDAEIYKSFDIEVGPYGFLLNDQGVVISKHIVNSLDHLLILVEHSVDEETRVLSAPRRDEPEGHVHTLELMSREDAQNQALGNGDRAPVNEPHRL